MARQEEPAEVRAAPVKGGNKMIIIAGVIVLSAATIGGGLFFGLKSHNVTSVAEAGGEKKAEPAKKKVVPVIYPLEAFIVNIGDGSEMRYLKVKIELDTALTAENVKKEMDPYLAPLRDSILVLLTTKTIQDIQEIAGKNRLREEILATVNRIMPAGKINAVYFTDFVVQ